MRTQTLDNDSFASDPGLIRLSHVKLKGFHPELYTLSGISRFTRELPKNQQFMLTRMEEHLLHGDSRAALVMCIKPLLVAAYTDELDYSAVLSFPEYMVERYELKVGSRLLTVNLYSLGDTPVPDLEYGSAACHRYNNFSPLIAEFLSDDYQQIMKRKDEIDTVEWERTLESAKEYAFKNKTKHRNGFPLYCGTPAR